MHEILRQLAAMLNFFKQVNEHEIRGASLFFVFCPKQEVYKVRLIDLGSFVPLRASPEGYDGVSRDTGLILGTECLIGHISALIDST